jgi:hypothetical protein
LIINDCVASDDRFVFLYYPDDKTFRPKLNENLCIGTSRTEVLADLASENLELSTCSDFHQAWTPFRSSRRNLAANDGQECSDMPLGWYDSTGDNCLWYAEGTRCNDFGGTDKKFGKTANQACCACGGGSNLDVDRERADIMNAPVTDQSCWDFVDWRDSSGYNCIWYSQGDHCSLYGNQFENEGGNANTACCTCGGGLSEAPSAESDFSDVPGCSNNPSNWIDRDGDSCAWYARDENCKKFGDGYGGVGNKTANEACCACGGGYNPNNIPVEDSGSNGTSGSSSVLVVYKSASLFVAWVISMLVLF